MPRIKLEETKNYEFTHQLNVRTYNLNIASHVGGPQMVDLIHEARVEYFSKLGVEEGNLGDGKAGILIGDLVINFKAEALRGDILSIGIHIGEIREKSFRVFYRIKKGETLVALAEIGIVTFNFVEQKRIPVPVEFKNRLKSFKKNSGLL